MSDDMSKYPTPEELGLGLSKDICGTNYDLSPWGNPPLEKETTMSWTPAQLYDLEKYQGTLDEITDLDTLVQLAHNLKRERAELYGRIDKSKAQAKTWSRMMHKIQSRIQSVKAKNDDSTTL